MRERTANSTSWVEPYLYYGFRPWGGVHVPGIWTRDKTARRAELARLSEAELIQEGARILHQLVGNPAGADHVLPLSGGFDSRGLLGALLESVGPARLRTVTFGVPGTLDFELGRLIAKAAGVRSELIDLRTIRWHTADLVEFAAQHQQPLRVFFAYPYSQIRRCLKPESVVWSGIFGGSVVGTHHCYEEPSTSWVQARSRFMAANAYANKGSLAPPGYDPLSSLPDAPWHDRATLLYDDQLNVYIRQGCLLSPALETKGWEFQMPYLHPDWLLFVLSMPHRYRYALLYRQALVAAFPALFALPIRSHRGLPVSAAPWRVKLRRLVIRASKAPRRLIPSWPWGVDPVLNYLDFDQALRTKRDLRSVIDENIRDLARRQLVDWLDVERLWRQHRSGAVNRGDAVLLLASLELCLKAQELASRPDATRRMHGGVR